MQATAVILTAFVAPLATAAPAFSGQPLEITNLKTCEVAMGNTTVEFDVYDPDPLTLARARCTGSWEEGSGNYPSGGYSQCGNTTFAWNMATYKSFDDFTLGMKHNFEDPSVGKYPYNMVTNFGKASITDVSLKCAADDVHSTCHQHSNTTIKAPIYASIAKR